MSLNHSTLADFLDSIFIFFTLCMVPKLHFSVIEALKTCWLRKSME